MAVHGDGKGAARGYHGSEPSYGRRPVEPGRRELGVDEDGEAGVGEEEGQKRLV